MTTTSCGRVLATSSPLVWTLHRRPAATPLVPQHAIETRQSARSGGGQSTLASLLERYYKPQRSQLVLNGSVSLAQVAAS